MTSAELVEPDVAVLYSDSSRLWWAARAKESGLTYAFVDAEGRKRIWVKGSYAYLAPFGAGACLNRLGITHRMVCEEQTWQGELDRYRILFIPNAPALAARTVQAVGSWLRGDPDRLLVVSGYTPQLWAMLGLKGDLQFLRKDEFVSWSACDKESRGRSWCPVGAPGYPWVRPSGRVAGDVLLKLQATRASGDDVVHEFLGPGVLCLPQAIIFTASVFEYLGALIQSHVQIEPVRLRCPDAFHHGDQVVSCLRALLLRYRCGREILRQGLCPFGSYDGVVSLRHDVDLSADTSMLEWEVANSVPATYMILDPCVSGDATTDIQARLWVLKCQSAPEILEPSLHNDTLNGWPPRMMTGQGLAQHIALAQARLGFTVETLGRHGGYWVYPEVLDAIKFASEQFPQLLGGGVFSFYYTLEYGNPLLLEGNRWLSYKTATHPTIATSGFWFPFKPAVCYIDEHHQIRYWDVTHEADCTAETLDEVFRSPEPLLGEVAELANPVFSLQFHPCFTRFRPADREGNLDSVKRAVEHAVDRNLWLANQRMLFQRMIEWEWLSVRRTSGGRWQVANAGHRAVDFLVMRGVFSPDPWFGRRGAEPCDESQLVTSKGYCVHFPQPDRAKLPPIGAGEVVEVWVSSPPPFFPTVPRITQPDTRFLTIDWAVFDPVSSTVKASARIAGRADLVVRWPGVGKVRALLKLDGQWQGEARELHPDPQGCLRMPLTSAPGRINRVEVRLVPAKE
ncbi:MAG: hypothetical protein ACOY3F_11835 [Bacillota bacterium]